MSTDITVTETKYIICYNLDIMLLHYVVLEPGQHLSTGQPEIELFDSEDEVVARMIELGFNPDDYIKRYVFLMYSTMEEAKDVSSDINDCLGETYIFMPFTMESKSDGSIMGYVILVDDKIKTCLTETQISHLMTISSSKVILL